MTENELYHFGILGMRWGVRKYQNEDGTLTEAGQKRYNMEQYQDSDKDANKRRRADPDRWVSEDLARTQKLTSSSIELVKKANEIERSSAPKPVKRRLNLDYVDDKTLRDAVSRELLERQYNDLFAREEPPNVSRGRETVREILEIAGTVLAIGGTALSIAQAIRELRGPSAKKVVNP